MRSALVFLAAFLIVLSTWGGAGAVVAHAPASSLPVGGTLMMTVSVDAAGVRVEQVVHKPRLAVRAERRVGAGSMTWRMLGAEGRVVAQGAFDPGPMDLDPARLGEADRVQGDVVIARQVAMNVKVPAVAFESIEFFRADGAPFGSVLAAALEVR